MTLLDTTVMVAFLKGKMEAIKKINELIENNDRIAITIFTVYELLKGAYLSARHEENVLDVTQAISGLVIFDLSPQACEEAARIYFDLKRTGTLIGEIDILIAAIAKINGEAILTRDKHFKCIKGLELANW